MMKADEGDDRVGRMEEISDIFPEMKGRSNALSDI
jgi:hypothetical protein